VGPVPDLIDPDPRQSDSGPATAGPLRVELLDELLEPVKLETDQPAGGVDLGEQQLEGGGRHRGFAGVG
jgi:hypothetical protein